MSSTLMERYGIDKNNGTGTVLWHSLNEQGKIGTYDMKFGDTIVRNLLAEDVEPVVEAGHAHPKRDDDERRK